MKTNFNNFYTPVLAFIFLVITSCGTSQSTGDDLVADSQSARANVVANHPNVSNLFNQAVGYAIFPNAGKGAYIIGGASGNGTVYQNGKLIGYADMKQIDIGLQAGGKAFVEILFFESQEALDEFKQGSYELSANASAVILEEGVSAEVDFEDGVAIVTMPKAGAMAGISVGGQRFEFHPVQ